MDIINLIAKTPGLFDALKSLGLSSDQVAMIGGGLTQQLRSQGEFDLSDLMKSMDEQDFAKRVDVARLSESTKINRGQVQAAADLIAPEVEAFGLDTKNIVTRMGSIAGSLFKSN